MIFFCLRYHKYNGSSEENCIKVSGNIVGSIIFHAFSVVFHCLCSVYKSEWVFYFKLWKDTYSSILGIIST